MRSKGFALLFIAALLATSIGAYAQAVIYDFTGKVTASSNPAISVGATVTGRYTFNYAAGIPGYSSGTVGSSSWSVVNPGSTADYWTPAQIEARTVFTSTATVGKFSYGTAQPAGYYEVISFVDGSPSGSGYEFYAYEESYPMGSPAFYSWLRIDTLKSVYRCSDGAYRCPDGVYPWTTTGLPIISAKSTAVGGITDALGDNIAYDVTSLTPLAADLLKALYRQVIGVGPGRSLEHKVVAAEAYYAARDIVATCAMLSGFNNEVQALSGKKINPKLASTLIADDDAIKGLIDCQ